MSRRPQPADRPGMAPAVPPRSSPMPRHRIRGTQRPLDQELTDHWSRNSRTNGPGTQGPTDQELTDQELKNHRSRNSRTRNSRTIGPGTQGPSNHELTDHRTIVLPSRIARETVDYVSIHCRIGESEDHEPHNQQLARPTSRMTLENSTHQAVRS